jgi:hypothetical protein
MQKDLRSGDERPDELATAAEGDEERETRPIPWMAVLLFGGFLALIIVIQMMCATP